MNINDINNIVRTTKEEMPLGIREVTFEKLDYRVDKDTGVITGAFVHVKEWRPLFIPVFEDLNKNFNLDGLLDQLGCISYAPEEINKAEGTVIKVSKYLKTVRLKEPKINADGEVVEYANYTNVNFDYYSITRNS